MGIQTNRPRTHTKQARNIDRKSTRLNSSHSQISYAVFCLKKKKKNLFENDKQHVEQLSSELGVAHMHRREALRARAFARRTSLRVPIRVWIQWIRSIRRTT